MTKKLTSFGGLFKAVVKGDGSVFVDLDHLGKFTVKDERVFAQIVLLLMRVYVSMGSNKKGVDGER